MNCLSISLYQLSRQGGAVFQHIFYLLKNFIAMNKLKTTIREATEKWIDGFSYVPGSVIEKLVKHDESVSYYDSDSFRLIASPRIECLGCNGHCDREFTIAELREASDRGKGIPCEHCQYNNGDDWQTGKPEYAFPCGWGTLFAPKSSLDIDWAIENKEEIGLLGFFVFESEDWEILLGIDAGGFDFYETYWIPLYKLRGLQWHELN